MSKEKITFDEAVARGRSLYPEVKAKRYSLFHWTKDERLCGACALGFAALGCGIEPNFEQDETIQNEAYEKLHGIFGMKFVHTIMHAFDSDKLPIKSIIAKYKKGEYSENNI